MDYDTKDFRRVHAFVVEEKGAIDTDAHRVNFVVSTDVVDRDNEQVLPEAVFEAIGRKEFVKNPVCLACHKHRLDNGEPPGIGSWDTKTRKLKKHHVEMVLQFDIEYELGNKYWIVYKNKTMRAVSIGFRILDGHEETINGKRIYIITKIELYEISCVAIGANPAALSKMKAMFGQSDVDIKAIASEITKNVDLNIKQQFDEFIVRIEDQLDEIKSLLIPGQEGFAKSMLGEDSERSDPAGNNNPEQLASIAGTLEQINEKLNSKQE